ncbi:MAG: hypothetical protein VXV96_11290 [Bdellovibrionota bacterium]|nr:hypothetical protein [Bdellovibrionota bacterium]
MDLKFQKYLEHHSRWNRFALQVSAWWIAMFVPGWIYKYFLDYESCVLNDPDFREILAPKDVFYNEWIVISCVRDIQHHLVACTWIAMIIVFAALLMFKPEAIDLKVKKTNAKSLDKRTVLSSILIEWLPTIIGAIYILTSSALVSISSAWTIYMAIGFAQLVWQAPVWFVFSGKNIADTITGIEYEVSNKVREKLQTKFKRKPRIKDYGSPSYGLLLLFCVFGLIQAIRVPEQNPAYQEALYGGTEPVWEDNIYFAMQGLSAPEDIEDFYKYGEVFAHKRFRAFRSMKRRSGVSEEFLYDVPEMEYGSIDTNKDKLIKVNDDWKKLSCIYNLREIKNDSCASISDVPKYIDMNVTLWERYNQIPEMGGVYKTPPQLLGGELDNYLEMAELKAAHIIYLAENEQPEAAMKEWLRFMGLYRAMAKDHNSMVMKSIMAVHMQRFIKTLETLLYLSPELAISFDKSILNVLKVDKNIFNEQDMLAADWGQIEPYSLGALGNQNAMQNKLHVCIEAFRNLALKSVEDFPYATEKLKLCPIDQTNLATHKYLIEAALTPGIMRANIINVLLMPGVLKGQGLIERMKILEVEFLQAKLAVKVLSEGVLSEKIESYISEIGSEYHNPIEGAPFKWNPKEQALSFQRPDGKRPSYFKINL